MLTVKQAAKQFNVSPSLIYQWCKEQRLIHYRAGGQGKRGRILIDPDDLRALFKSLRREVHPLASLA